ncbi:hypothetical protein HHK36_008150 [Tetracentron sinense]|uniref:Uncharacterized protein n=1 Tax=Tetracentron sinense TaxID=13715 RepID=A0A834ZF20_TETSI|nr:hypothetical protein HHK36_008150 [Tetracentron sinense]
MGIVVGDDQATRSMSKAGLDFGDEFDCANVEQFPIMNEEFGIDDIAEGTEASTEQSKAMSMDKIAEAMHTDVEVPYASDLYAKVMKIEGFEFDFFDDAFGILNDDDKLSRTFLARNERGRRKMPMTKAAGLEPRNDDLDLADFS